MFGLERHDSSGIILAQLRENVSGLSDAPAPVSVEVESPNDKLVFLSDVHVEADETGLHRGEYTLRNRTSKEIKAFGVVWSIYSAEEAQPPFRINSTLDAWFTRASGVRLGDYRQSIAAGVEAAAPAKLDRIKVSLDYVEFAEGTKIGPNTGGFEQHFEAERAKERAVVETVTARMRAGEIADAAIDRAVKETQPGDSASRYAIDVLRTILSEQGPGALSLFLQNHQASK